jgi:hypothetical protein
MELEYGQRLELLKDVNLVFLCDGILPAGQMGYKEKHYKIRFDQASLILPESLVSQLFKIYEVVEPVIEPEIVVEEVEEVEEKLDEIVNDLSKLKKDELIQMVHTAFPDKDCSGLKKDELIKILEGPTNA